MAITKVGESQRFDYTASIQEFVAPFDGLYELDIFGAKGNYMSYSSSYASGGNGGRSIGYVILTKGTKLYVVVGSGGYNGTGANYNGGGAGNGEGAAGGGATHIATVTGLLNTLSSNKSTILLVAGGGGGAAGYKGGYGGGTSGGNGGAGNSSYTGVGGTQSSGWSFGLGQNSPDAYTSGGGGGGYYGGKCGGNYNGASGGGGGSGYIGGVPIITYKDKTYSPSTTGNINANGDGYAIITLVDKESSFSGALGDIELVGASLGDIELIGIALGDALLE